ncbi:hypothetical protein FHS31_000445 [Sphingomonas vulcanisoli]|uniref:PepSY domain-containing protein n=1 Tax=Sphingomonas vulcanisoli TaxID=1658060 RepID=A0ABX0TMW2_9SPHN|nr:hypothetical protein [Sphingomonas vulcanisoli]NIJ06863.1 hypothetical protein [Sphingomonas vulcanisoli]
MRLQLLWLWVLVVVLYFSWEAASYRGLFAIMAEWQFDRLGQDLPTFNFCLLTMVFGWPALLILRRRRARELDERDAVANRALIGLDDESVAHVLETRRLKREGALALLAARDYMHFLFGFTAALWFAAVMALLWTLALPSSMDNPRVYTPDSLQQPQIHEGAAAFRGTLRYGRISSFSRGILFARRTALYAPLFPPKGANPDIRYFVEFLPAERPDIHSGSVITHREGVLVRSDLPGALIRLYRYLGYHPSPRYYVLYVNLATMRWPYYVIALQFLLGGATFLASGLWQRRHIGKLRTKVRQDAAAQQRTLRKAMAA